MKRAYLVDPSIDPSSLPWVFDTDNRGITTDGSGYVEVDGSLPNGTETTLRVQPDAGVPLVVSRFQARAALHLAGLLPSVEAAVAQADDLTKLAWNDAIEFRRTSPALLGLASALNLTEQQLDDLFVTAAQIEA